MSIQKDRNALFEQGMTRTMAGKELFHRYYRFLELIAGDLKNSQVSEISILADKIQFRTEDGIRLNYSFGDIGVISQWLILPGTEKGEKAVIENILKVVSSYKTDFSFYDIGANIGWYSLWVGKKYPSGRIFAFEPAPAAYEQIKINLKLNDLSNVTPFNIGFADTPGSKEFFFCSEIQTASSLADTLKNTSKEKIICNFETVDQFSQKHNSSPDFIKCDVEGAEYLVIKGAAGTLQESRPVLMLEMLRKWMRCFNVHPNDLIAELKKYGYCCYTAAQNDAVLYPVKTIDDSTEETNFFFLHPEKHSAVLQQLKIKNRD